MTPEELLQPRIMCTKDYLGRIFSLNEVIPLVWQPEFKDWAYVDCSRSILLKRLQELDQFKLLQWWEKRKPTDMPAYIKIHQFPYEGEWMVQHVDGTNVKHYFDSDAGYFGLKYKTGGGTFIGDQKPHFWPATEAEYLEYKNKNNS